MRGAYEPLPDFFGENMKKLVNWCVMKNPAHRPDTTDIVSLAFMQKYLVKAQLLGFPELPASLAASVPEKQTL